MPIKEADKSYDHDKIEKKVQKFWKEEETFAKVNELREKGPRYSFLDGPPYCSGKIHLGTAWNKIIKDSYLRFKSMNGFNLRRQAGWDMHGLPIENKVEHLMNIQSKQEIEEIGIDKFVDKCREFAIENKIAMEKEFDQVGVWMDWNNPYMTLDPKYMESSWWMLKRANEQDLLVNNQRVISWCPHCGTALAAAEIEYEEKVDPSIYIKFPVSGEENTYFLVWTTTPWTLPANLAICANPEFDYVYVLKDGETYILAENLMEDILGKQVKIHRTKIPAENDDEDQIIEEKEVMYEIVKTVKGEDLLGMGYDYILADEVPKQMEFDSEIEKVHTILLGDHVELGEGTGLVHTAPGHGPDDFEIGKANGLPIFCPVGEDGCFNSEAGKYACKFTKDENNQIIKDLEDKNLMYRCESIEHRYGVCWRCKSPIIYRATKQWFLKVTDIKQKMLDEIEKVEWVPKWAGEGRFHDWVDNARDWTISRQRYWGIPIPIWECPDCGELKVIGSLDELKKESLTEINVSDAELIHRPYVDEVEVKCDCCNHPIKRIPDVLDVWIDSGVAGWASLYYPKENDKFKDWFPYDFITEGHDQTRGWFYSQLGTGVISMGQSPYKKVLMHGFVLDEHGNKMSKSLGNVVSPEEVIEKYGADVLRFYLLWASKPWDDLKFVWEELLNINKMFNILWNVYVFSTTYMSLDNFNPIGLGEDDMILRAEDKWIISKANSLIKEVGEDLEDLFFHKATRKINNFILEDLSRWYVRLIRGRTWVESDNPDKLGAYYSLYTALVKLIEVLCPIAPHVSEEIYENLVTSLNPEAPESIHMLDWEYEGDAIDKELEAKMDVAREVIEASIKARDMAQYKLRWPVSDITVVSQDENVLNAVEELKDIIKDQSNAKEVLRASEFEKLSFIAKPNLKILGPKLKGDMGKVVKGLKTADGNQIKAELETNGSVVIEGIELSSKEVLFDSELPDDFVSSEFEGGNVFVNTNVTLEIRQEAMARELIRRVQDMRKDLDLDVESNIHVDVETSSEFKDLIVPQSEVISHEVRAKSLIITDTEECSRDSKYYTKEWDIEGVKVIISIKN
ncbi:isoleucine--tRNA ligase [Methanobrevibacter sp. V74]|uniref:isoleucine--tRNA ligase n=1 Tax=Methanobrevibacter sp. V74 TaxID=3064279 RepID=UPI0027335725|nr:isoleucine--tRNA ligase [Methanobrevibacter sp. V74]